LYIFFIKNLHFYFSFFIWFFLGLKRGLVPTPKHPMCWPMSPPTRVAFHPLRLIPLTRAHPPWVDPPTRPPSLIGPLPTWAPFMCSLSSHRTSSAIIPVDDCVVHIRSPHRTASDSRAHRSGLWAWKPRIGREAEGIRAEAKDLPSGNAYEAGPPLS
jgi:hypothetical protein